MLAIAAVNVIIHGAYIGSRVVVALLALELGAGHFEIGLLVGTYALFSLLLAVHSGKVSDRFGVRKPMLGGAAASALALLIPWVSPTLPALFVSASIIGAGFVFWNVSVQNLTGLLGGETARARNFSTLSLSYSVSSFAGPMVAGYAIDHAGHSTAYGIFALSIVPALAFCALHPSLSAVKPQTGDGNPRRSMDLWRHPGLARMFVMSGLVVTGWDLFQFYLPIYAHSIGLSPTTIGTLLGVFAAATFLMRFGLPALQKRVRSATILGTAMGCAAAVFVGFPFVRDVNALAATCFVIGLLLGCGQPLTMTMTFGRSPAGRSGEVTGLRLSVNHFTHFLVPVLAGAAGAAFGMVPVFWANALCLATTAVLSRRA